MFFPESMICNTYSTSYTHILYILYIYTIYYSYTLTAHILLPVHSSYST
uniref:Uncharacterized protein n=1 Tax=Anguilla anguilla TaxID=7936 RepID=A0A0E9RI74_ANGAN